MNVSIDHPTDRPNFTKVYVGEITLWFSYRTCVAFQEAFGRIIVRENDWGPTTGKHLGMIGTGRREDRIPGVEFERLLGEALGMVNA